MNFKAQRTDKVLSSVSVNVKCFHELQNLLKMFSFEKMYKTAKKKFAINECKESRYTFFVRLLLALLADFFLIPLS